MNTLNTWALTLTSLWRSGRHTALAGAALAASLLAVSAGAQTPEPVAPSAPLRLRVVGGLASVNQYTRHEAPFWTRELARLTGGRATADIVPFDQAGLRGQDMLRLVSLGTLPLATALLARVQANHPELAAPDLPGMNPDMKSLRRNVAAWRPHMARLLKEQHGVELLAVYAYPAQVTWCKRPFVGLSDLTGRRVRVANVATSELMRTLGAIPVMTDFADMVSHFRSGNVECAVTGAMSGNILGLHEVTAYLDTRAISWGLSLFVAHEGAWRALPAEVRQAIQTGLPKLEAAIWDESERETTEGVACNTGAPACVNGRKGRMQQVLPSPKDSRHLESMFASDVLPAWITRCGPDCVTAWNQNLAAITGITAKAPR